MRSLLRSSDGRRPRRVAAISLLLAGVVLTGCGGQQSENTAAPDSSPSPQRTASGQPTRNAAMDHSVPTRITIPAIDVRSPVNKVGLTPQDRIEVPPLSRPELTGWYKHGPTPGELGPAVILGHVDNEQGPAVFYDLKTLERGAKVKVTRRDGSVAVFRVTSVERFPKDEFPTERVYGDLPYAGLRLITCGGAFNESTQHYEDNIIAFARLVASQPAA